MRATESILLVEDDDVDVMTVQRALNELGVKNPLSLAANGEEALDLLEKSDSVPGIILLDINMPKMNGIEFLRVIKEDERYRRIPIIVFTTSKEDQDKYDSFNLGVAGYMIKPVDYRQFVEMMKTIKMYWERSERAGC